MSIAFALAVLIVVIILIYYFYPNAFASLKSERLTPAVSSGASPTPSSSPSPAQAPSPSAPPKTPPTLPAPIADSLLALGYSDGADWAAVIQTSEVDPATFASQAEYVRDVRRFSSGANFTNVSDDNNSFAFTNFVGLQRPQAIPNMVGSSARQVPDIDEDVLVRNKQLRW